MKCCMKQLDELNHGKCVPINLTLQWIWCECECVCMKNVPWCDGCSWWWAIIISSKHVCMSKSHIMTTRCIPPHYNALFAWCHKSSLPPYIEQLQISTSKEMPELIANGNSVHKCLRQGDFCCWSAKWCALKCSFHSFCRFVAFSYRKPNSNPRIERRPSQLPWMVMCWCVHIENLVSNKRTFSSDSV